MEAAMSTGTNTTLIVWGYALPLVGFVILIAQIVVVSRSALSAQLRRLTDVYTRRVEVPKTDEWKMFSALNLHSALDTSLTRDFASTGLITSSIVSNLALEKADGTNSERIERIDRQLQLLCRAVEQAAEQPIARLRDQVDKEVRQLQEAQQQLREAQRQASDKLKADFTKQIHKEEQARRRDTWKQAGWSAAATLFFISGTVLGIIGTVS
jgi:hypothetical protein